MSEPNALAEGLLEEAVYASRARQAAGTLIAQDRSHGAAPGCGLGLKAEIVLELSPRGAELFERLWHREPAPEVLEHIRAQLAAWIEAQDRLDRKRNHFLKEFRQRHGFDRAAYSLDQLARFESGLAEINAESTSARRAAAAELAALAPPIPPKIP